MTPTNVVSMNFKTKEAMQEFLDMYEKDSPTLFPFFYYLLTDSIRSPSNTSISWISNANFSLHWFALVLIVSKFSFVSTMAKVNTETGVALTQWISWIPSTSNFKDLINSLWLAIYFSHSVWDLKLKIFVTVILSFFP